MTRSEHLDGLLEHLPKPTRIKAVQEMIERGCLNHEDAKHFRKVYLDLTNKEPAE